MSSFIRFGVLASSLTLVFVGVACTAGTSSNGNGIGSNGGEGGAPSSASTTLVACAPLTSEAISLPSPVLGVGKDGSGTFFVAAGVDPGNGSPRVFVSAASGLEEQAVTGSGMSSNGGGTDYSMSFVAPGETAKNAARTLFVTTSGGNATAMSLSAGATKGPSGDQPLTVQPSSAITALTVKGLPLVPAFMGSLDDGTLLVVVQSTDKQRIFFGLANDLAERKIISANTDHVSPAITFDMNGDTYVSTYHYSRSKSGEGGTNGMGDSSTWTLATPSGTESVKISFDASTIAGAQYQCIQ
jgi:hypothetical protein